MPAAAGTIENNLFTPLKSGECKIKAESVSDPTLCDVVKVNVS